MPCLLTFVDWYHCHIYILCLLRQIFLAADSSRICSKKHQGNSYRRHSVLMLLSLSSVTNLSSLFGFCAACMLSYRFLQMERWAAVTVVIIPSQQPALLMWPCVSAARPSVLSPQASRAILHSRHPAECIMPSCIFGQLTACWRNSCHGYTHLQTVPPWNLVFTQNSMEFGCHSNTLPNSILLCNSVLFACTCMPCIKRNR